MNRQLGVSMNICCHPNSSLNRNFKPVGGWLLHPISSEIWEANSLLNPQGLSLWQQELGLIKKFLFLGCFFIIMVMTDIYLLFLTTKCF